MTHWLRLPKPWLFLAPMAGVGDWAFREMCYRFGAEVAVSHLVPVTALLVRPAPLLEAIGARHGNRPFAVQLCGHRPDDFRQAARLITDHIAVASLDINMGCPVAPVVSHGGGSALLRDPQCAAAIVEATCAGTPLPVTVKLRTGWHTESVSEMAPLLEAAGASALIVHGRTREQHYRGSVSLDAIAAAKRSVSIPVIGNGDITSLLDARRMLDETGVDGIMIGRGALGNPWLYAQLQSGLKGNRVDALDQRFGDVIREHVSLAFDDLGPRKAALALRKHLIAYSAGSPCSGQLRKALETMRSRADIDRWIAILEESKP